MRGINVEITIRDNTTGKYLHIPVVPAEIPYTDGDALTDSVKILNLGNVNFPNGVDLDSLSLNSFFPAKYDPWLCVTSNLLTPIEYRNQFSSWKDKGISLQVIIPAAGINKTMYISNFNWTLKGHEGDIYYTLTFTELKTIKPKQLTPGGTAPPPGKKTAKDRNPAPQKTTPKTHSVRAGDTLTRIAKLYSIPDWRTVYNKNKAAIGANPAKLIIGTILKL